VGLAWKIAKELLYNISKRSRRKFDLYLTILTCVQNA